jgi:hypothetical protein
VEAQKTQGHLDLITLPIPQTRFPLRYFSMRTRAAIPKQCMTVFQRVQTDYDLTESLAMHNIPSLSKPPSTLFFSGTTQFSKRQEVYVFQETARG